MLSGSGLEIDVPQQPEVAVAQEGDPLGEPDDCPRDGRRVPDQRDAEALDLPEPGQQVGVRAHDRVVVHAVWRRLRDSAAHSSRRSSAWARAAVIGVAVSQSSANTERWESGHTTTRAPSANLGARRGDVVGDRQRVDEPFGNRLVAARRAQAVVPQPQVMERRVRTVAPRDREPVVEPINPGERHLRAPLVRFRPSSTRRDRASRRGRQLGRSIGRARGTCGHRSRPPFASRGGRRRTGSDPSAGTARRDPHPRTSAPIGFPGQRLAPAIEVEPADQPVLAPPVQERRRVERREVGQRRRPGDGELPRQTRRAARRGRGRTRRAPPPRSPSRRTPGCGGRGSPVGTSTTSPGWRRCRRSRRGRSTRVAARRTHRRDGPTERDRVARLIDRGRRTDRHH